MRILIRRIALFAIILGVILAAKAYYDTMRDPVVELLTITSSALPAGSPRQRFG